MAYFDKDDIRPFDTIPYATHDGTELSLDLFRPDTPNGAAIICVHGGGWKNGSREQFRWHASRMADEGYTAISVSYRLIDTACFPGALRDVQAAVAWLRQRADEYGFATDRIGALGSSAGGQLVALLGTDNRPLDGIDTRVNCVVDVHGVHDFVTLSKCPELKPNRLAYMGGTIDEVPDNWHEASPALRIDEHTPPILVTHDPNDKTVPYEQSQILVNALVSHGRDVRFVPTPGSGHGFVYGPQNPWTQRIWPAIGQWFDEWLLGD